VIFFKNHLFITWLTEVDHGSLYSCKREKKEINATIKKENESKQKCYKTAPKQDISSRTFWGIEYNGLEL